MKDRIIELLERGERVELECVHGNAIATSYAEALSGNQAVVSHLLDDKIIFENSFFIYEGELEHFKIKETEYTFNDLIDVAVQAYKDGYIRLMRLDNDVLDISYNIDGDGLCGFLTSKTEESGYQFGQYIRDINSLYTETFVIESEENTNKIDVFKCPRFELKNGVRGTIQKCFNNKEFSVQFEDKSWGNIGFMVLKGATVTQKRGERK